MGGGLRGVCPEGNPCEKCILLHFFQKWTMIQTMHEQRRVNIIDILYHNQVRNKLLILLQLRRVNFMDVEHMGPELG